MTYLKEPRELVERRGLTPKPQSISQSNWIYGGDVIVGRVRHGEKTNVEPVGEVLSIDPGLADVGYAVFNGRDKIVTWGLISTSPKTLLTQRLKIIHHRMRLLLRKYGCKYIVLEDFYGSPDMQNRGAVISLAKAHGAIQVLPRSVTLVHTLSVRGPQKIRNRDLRKEDAIRRVKKIYGLRLKKYQHHVADAILQGRWFYEQKKDQL